MLDSNRSKKLSYIGIIIVIILGLYASSLYSYLLFHSLIEIFTIAVAFMLFILIWNTRAYSENNYLRLLGIGYAFIAFIDLLHTLAFKGMNVFQGFDANLPTQLWIAARYLQTVTLCIAPLFVERRADNRAIFGGYAAAILVLVAIVYSGNFPDCFIEGKGLTAFKIGSEYVISALLFVSLFLFYRKRSFFNNNVFFLIAFSIICTVLSEISFTTYISVYGFANMLGHFSKLAAFYLIYRAVLVTGLKDPFDLIFRDLKQTEEELNIAYETLEDKVRERTAELRTSEEKYRSLINKVQVAIVLHDGQGRILDSNPLAQKLLGLSADQLLGKSLIDPKWHFLREDRSIMPVDEYPARLVLSRQYSLRGYVAGISHPNQENIIWVLVNAEPEYNEAGEITLVIVSFVEITRRKEAEEKLRESELRLHTIWDTEPECVKLVSNDGLLLDINSAGLAMLDVDNIDHVIGKPFIDWVAPEYHQHFLTIYQHALNEGSAIGTYELIGSKGTKRWVETHVVPLEDNESKITMLLSVTRDISEQKRSEDDLHKLNEELEQRVKDRTAEMEQKNVELERMNKLFVGRELRMQELKYRIGELEKVANK
jgi:PAS domain S-box-containing protein